MILKGATKELEDKPAPVSLCPPQIPHGLTRARNRASAVRGGLRTAWAMARPYNRIDNEEWIGKEKEGCGRGLICGTIPALYGEAEETLDNFDQDNRSLDRDSNLGPPEYEAAVLWCHVLTQDLDSMKGEKCELSKVFRSRINSCRKWKQNHMKQRTEILSSGLLLLLQRRVAITPEY
jgi:hypothetical protein